MTNLLTGSKLVQIAEKPIYENGEKTDKMAYEATCIAPHFEGAPLVTVKLERKPKIENVMEMPEVTFNDLSVNAWIKDGRKIELSFRANSIE